MYRSRKRFLQSALAPSLASFGVLTSGVRAAQFDYKLGHNLPASHPTGVAATEFAEAVKRESGGRVDIKVFPDNSLGNDDSMLAQLRLGGLQYQLLGYAPLSAIAPLAAIALIGFPFKSASDAVAALDATAPLGGLIRTALDQKGILVFEKSWGIGFRQIASGVKPVRTVDDLAGLKIRVVPNAISLDMWRTLGASPVALSLAELYTSLQTHLVAACDNAVTILKSLRVYEVTQYLSITNHQWAQMAFAVSPEPYKALPPDLQAIVRRNANLAATRESRSAYLQEQSAGDQLERLGMKTNVANTATFRARLTSYYQRWKTEFGPAAWAALEQYSGRLG